MVREFPTDENVNFDVHSGLSPHQLRERLLAGEVIVGSVLAQRENIHAGELLKIDTRDGVKELLVAAVANEYMSGGLTVTMQRTVAKRLLNVEGVDAYIIKTDAAHRPAVEAALRKFVRGRGTDVSVVRRPGGDDR